MEVEESEEKKNVDDSVAGENIKQEECIETNGNAGDENFKKPMLITKAPSKKSTLHKYLQQTKLNSVSNKTEEQESIVDNVSENIPASEPAKSLPNKIFPIPYTEPEWKGISTEKYKLEELKSGVIERSIDLQTKSYYCFGRVENSDICMAHPTVSRYHAVLQYRDVSTDGEEKGFYLYDLKSTHGTFLNKCRIKPNVYARVKVGHIIKIGCSSRFFVLRGPPEDEEEESPLTITEIKAQRQAELDERKRKEEEEWLLAEQEREKQERLLEEKGISWGMAEDADEETDLTENPYAQETNEELYIDDPKKALRIWFEREGEELSFDTEKAEKGLFLSKIVLPIDRGDGREIVVESSARNKKESQTQCSLEACRIIDRMGLLRPAKREAKKQQKRNWEENDYYDSDEDTFLDRTGDIDRKREKRMRRAGKIQDAVETYESLMEKHKIVLEKLETAGRKLNNLLEDMKVVPEEETPHDDIDELDAYMLSLKQKKKPNKIEIKLAKSELSKLQDEETNLRKLINIAKPASMPELILQKKNTAEDNKSSAINMQKEDVIENIEEIRTNAAESFEKEDQPESAKPEAKPARVIGPILPQDVKLNKPQGKSKPKENPKKKKLNEKLDESNYMEDDVYSNCVWEPPSGQTGDGRTSLNDKYGY